MGFSKPLRSLVFAFSALLVVGTVVSPAQAAATATPLFLSFETDDALGAEVAKPAAPGHALGSWYPGAVTAIAPTPAPTHPGRALSFVKSSDAAAWSGLTVFDGGSATSYTNTANPVISFDYYSPSVTDTPVEIKLEVVGSPQKSAYKVLAAAPGWHTLTFDMSSGANNWSGTAGYNRLSIIPDFGGDQAVPGLSAAACSGQIYYIDNVAINGGTLADVQTGGPAPTPTPTSSAIPVYLSFETDDVNGANSISTDAGLGAFEGGAVSIASVPTTNGHSGKGAKFVKAKAGNAWSGYKFIFGADQFRYTSASKKLITLDYHASVASPVQIKLETANGDAVMLTKSASVGWNSLSYDMSTAPGWSENVAFNLVSIFPDFSDDKTFTSVSPNDQVFYIDNVSINGGTISDVGAQPSASASPSASPTSTGSAGVTCTKGTPTIRLLTPANSDLNGTPSGYDGVWQWNDPGTVVYSHNFPLRSTVAVKYQALDLSCNPVAAGTKVYLAVNANYSRAKTAFINVYHDPDSGIDSITGIDPIPDECAASAFCGEGQTVLVQPTDAQGQVTFELTNLNATSTENKPQSLSSLPVGTNLTQSVFSPSFSDFHADSEGHNIGAGGANLYSKEAVDVLWPHFTNGLGDVVQPGDVTGTVGTNKTLVYTIRDASGNAIPNAAVTVITDDGGSLVSPSSAGAVQDINGYSRVSATANAQGKVTVVAKSTRSSVQGIQVKYSVSGADTALTAVNGFANINWQPAKVAQTIGAVKSPLGKGKTLVLPAKTSKNLAIKWSTSTKAICKVATVKGVTKLTGLKSGSCKVSGSNAGSSTVAAVTKAVTVAIK